MVQINELDYAIEVKITKTDNVKNELEADPKRPNNTRRWCIEVPMPDIPDPNDPEHKKTIPRILTVGVPDPRTVQCFIDNNMELHDHYYRIWRSFLQDTQRQKHYAIVKQVKRSRIIAKGSAVGIYLVALEIFARNNNERRQQYILTIGKWDNVSFLKDPDPKTGELIAYATDSFVPNYDFVYDEKNEQSRADMQYWLDHSAESVQMYCIPSIRGVETLNIMERDTFVNASFAELMECGRRGLLLSDLKEMKAYYTAMTLGKTAPFVTSSSSSKAKVETKKD